MPYNPQTSYRGDSYVFQGGRDTATALSGWLENFLNQQKQVANAGKSADYFVKANPDALQEMGVHPDEWDNLGARDKANAVQGYVQGKAAQRATAEAQAQVQLRQAQAFKAQQDADSASGMPQFAGFLNDELNNNNGGSATTTAPSWPPPGQADWGALLRGQGPQAYPVQTSGTSTGSTPSAPAGPPAMSQAVLRALAKVQSLNPRVAAAIAAKVLPDMLKNGANETDSTPQVMTGPNGETLFFQKNTKNPPVLSPYSKANAQTAAQQKLIDARTTAAGAVTPKDQFNSLVKQKIEFSRNKATAISADEKAQWQQEIDALNPQIQALTPGAAARTPTVTPLAVPKTKGELKTGQLYHTQKGLATWDGQQFVPQK